MTLRGGLIWAAVVLVCAVPILAAAQSPLLAWRRPIYIAAGFAGIIAMVLLFLQPLLAKGVLPGLATVRGRRVHRAVGAMVVLAVVAHVASLWITSPPDVIDVLLLRSPTPFAVWGVAAMWALFTTLVLAITRRRWAPRMWRMLHVVLAVIIVSGTVVHAIQIDGTMESVTKIALSVLVILANGVVVWGVLAQLRRITTERQNRAGSTPP